MWHLPILAVVPHTLKYKLEPPLLGRGVEQQYPPALFPQCQEIELWRVRVFLVAVGFVLHNGTLFVKGTPLLCTAFAGSFRTLAWFGYSQK